MDQDTPQALTLYSPPAPRHMSRDEWLASPQRERMLRARAELMAGRVDPRVTDEPVPVVHWWTEMRQRMEQLEDLVRAHAEKIEEADAVITQLAERLDRAGGVVKELRDLVKKHDSRIGKAGLVVRDLKRVVDSMDVFLRWRFPSDGKAQS